MGDVVIWVIIGDAIPVAFARWIFRINDIVYRLDKIIELLTSKKSEEKIAGNPEKRDYSGTKPPEKEKGFTL